MGGRAAGRLVKTTGFGVMQRTEGNSLFHMWAFNSVVLDVIMRPGNEPLCIHVRLVKHASIRRDEVCLLSPRVPRVGVGGVNRALQAMRLAKFRIAMNPHCRVERTAGRSAVDALAGNRHILLPLCRGGHSSGQARRAIYQPDPAACVAGCACMAGCVLRAAWLHCCFPIFDISISRLSASGAALALWRACSAWISARLLVISDLSRPRGYGCILYRVLQL